MSRSRKDILATERMLAQLADRLAYAREPGFQSTDITYTQARRDAESLRRISMTLHRWHELECGVEAGGIDRDEETSKCWWYSSHLGKRTHTVPDREKGALARLARVMARYPTLTSYVQGDPRGYALYILRPGDVPEGKDAGAYYNRGLAVHR